MLLLIRSNELKGSSSHNFLYDLAQVTIPTDHVDRTFIHKSQRWSVGMIRDFMIYLGPISSIYDVLTFFALLKIFSASERLFHTGWFVESLATRMLLIFIIRTAGNPLASVLVLALPATTIAMVMAGIVIPFTSLGRKLGFTPLPPAFFLFLGIATGTYLLLVELVKRNLMRRFSR